MCDRSLKTCFPCDTKQKAFPILAVLSALHLILPVSTSRTKVSKPTTTSSPQQHKHGVVKESVQQAVRELDALGRGQRSLLFHQGQQGLIRYQG